MASFVRQTEEVSEVDVDQTGSTQTGYAPTAPIRRRTGGGSRLAAVGLVSAGAAHPVVDDAHLAVHAWQAGAAGRLVPWRDAEDLVADRHGPARVTLNTHSINVSHIAHAKPWISRDVSYLATEPNL